MPHDIDIDPHGPAPAADAGHAIGASLAEPVEGVEADDLDALASSTPPVDSWDERDAQEAQVDLAVLASTSPSAPSSECVDAGAARFALGLVAGLGIGLGLASLAFRVSAEASPSSRPTAPPATLRTKASSSPKMPTPTAARVVVPEIAVAGPVFVASEAPADARVSPPGRELSLASRGLPTAPQAPLPPAPIAQRAPAPAAAAPHPDPTPAVAVPADRVSERDLDTLLDQATSPMAERPESARRAEPADPEVLPLMPSRAQVEGVLEALRSAVRGCAMGQSGLATADIVVRSDGTVAGVQVTGAPFEGTGSGRCMQGVVRPVRFPRFTKPIFHVRFPFAIP